MTDVVPVAVPLATRLAVRMDRAPAVGFLTTVGLVAEWLFGVAVLGVGLAVLSAVPFAQFLTLGYLLEAGARVAKSGRLRDGFIGVRTAARLGGIVFFSWVFLLPVRFLADVADSARIISPGSTAAAGWRFGLIVLIGVTAVHILSAVARGGKLRHFLWPFNIVNVGLSIACGRFYQRCRDAVWDAVTGLRLPYYWWLGVRGFAAAFAWLVLPVSLLALGHAEFQAAPFVGFLGGFLLAVVLLYLPFLQLRVATENRFRAGFQSLEVRRAFRQAPVAHFFAVLCTLLFAVPLYLLKIEVVPKEAAWLPGLVFIAFTVPARLLTGWAVGRANRREAPRHILLRWLARLPLPAAAGAYVIVVFFSQYTSWNGVWGLYEQHAFLLPVPYVSF